MRKPGSMARFLLLHMDVTPPQAEEQALESPPKGSILDDLMTTATAVRQSPAFLPGVAIILGLFAIYWPLFLKLPPLWLKDQGYYSHGFLVPLISGYVVYNNWDRIKDTPIKPQWWVAVPLLAGLFFVRAAYRTDIMMFMSYGFVLTLASLIVILAGWKWLWKLLLPTGYLVFMLPVFGAFFDNNTNKLQLISATIAKLMLKVMGQEMQVDGTVIYLDHFTLNIAAACSGLKLLFAVTAFTVFFVLIARLRMLGNIIMFAFTVPLCLFINGLRIALIGLVGNYFGADAGNAFHDYSGYITLLICFFILFKFARILGWKD